MSEASPRLYVSDEVRHRIDKIFYGEDYRTISVENWLDGSTEWHQDPLMLMSRELSTRDIRRGHEISLDDTLIISSRSCGDWIVERIVYVETVDENDDTIDHFALNMYDGEIDVLHPESQPYSVQNFENRLRIVEDI